MARLSSDACLSSAERMRSVLYKQSKFCPICRAIDWQALIAQLEVREGKVTGVPLFQQPRTLGDLNCCELGRRILDSLNAHPALERNREGLWAKSQSSLNRDKPRHIAQDCETDEELTNDHSPIHQDQEVIVNLVDLNGDFSIETGVPYPFHKLATVHGDLRENVVPSKAAVEPLDSAQIVKCWLSECHYHHERCDRDQTAAYLPTRVIDVMHCAEDGSLCPRLIDTNGMRGDYITLSYVWGTGKRFVTTKDTLSGLRQRIDLQMLPTLFRGAILFARKLGIPFVWIDCICIVQDCSEDVTRELSRMTDIYRNCTLTLAAVGQRSVHSDLFRATSMNRVSNQWGYGRPTYLDCTVEGGCAKTYLPFGHPATLAYPLHTRAWCLQETLLSRRSLVLGLHEMFWFCNSYERRASKPDSPRERQPEDYEAEIYGPISPQKALSMTLWYRPFNYWYHLVAKYSQRKLSFRNDRLPALSGLAKLMAEYIPTESPTNEQSLQGVKQIYLAGLWRPDLWHGLLWRSAGSRFTPFPESKQAANAPSWSWATWETEVEWRRHVESDSPEHDMQLSEIVYCCTELASPRLPYGEVLHGELAMRGRLAPLPCRWQEDGSVGFPRHSADASDGIGKFCVCEAKYCSCTAHVNSGMLLDSSCSVLRMTHREALILSPSFRLRANENAAADEIGRERLQELQHELGSDLVFWRTGILVSTTRLQLDWSNEDIEVTIV
jgi:hypothetical protein